MNGSVLHWAVWSGMASLAVLSGSACAQSQVTPTFGLGTYRVADIIDPAHQVAAGSATNLGVYPAARPDSPVRYYSADAATSPIAIPDAERVSGESRAWGVTVGVGYGALTLRGAHQNRHVTNIRLLTQTGVNFDAKNSIAAANYRLGWGTAYAAYSASRGWGSSPLYNPDNPYSANIAGTASNDSRDVLCGVAVPLTRTTTFLASFIHKNDRELANRDANQLAFGASYKVSRRLDFYAAYSHIKTINDSRYVAANIRSASSAINVGMRRAF
jgi:predicted porin